ncbi:MAG: glycosyltransferase [Thermodesulfovibrionales bacterium]
MTLVSIIVRTKDRPKLLKKALQSIAAQTYRPIEVVLVNDGGCDLDVEEIRGILGDVSCNYIRLEKNTGRAHAGNVGIENAKGEFLGFLDDDDEFYPDHVETLLQFLENSDYRIAYTDADIIRSHYDPMQKRFIPINEGVFFSEDFSPDILLFENYIPLICLLIHREIFDRVGLFDVNFEIFEDWDLLIRMSRTYPFQHIASPTAKYYQWSRDFQIAHSDPALARIKYIEVLKKHGSGRTAQVAYGYFLKKQEQLGRRDLQIRELLAQGVKGSWEELRKKDEELQKKDIELREVMDKLQDKEEDLEKIKEELRNAAEESRKFREELNATAGELREVGRELQKTREELTVKIAYIEEVRSGIGWMILEWYRRNIKSVVAPVGSSRWKAYHKVLRGIRTLKKDGIKIFFGKVKRQFREVKASSSIKTELFKVPDVKCNGVENLGVKVSVVIPTKNGGTDFRQVLERIRMQKGIDVEIIVVDSGSTDDTIDLAGRFGSQVFSILPSEFGHGKTRNYGARHATGDFIVFLSQDAIPIGETCFADMVRGMKNDPKIAAVSAKQVPRSDADFFACWQIWNHYENFLRYPKDEIVSLRKKNLEELGHGDRRRISQIDNICSCIRRDVFAKYEFNDLPYAEDLDLGLRLVRSGYKIGFLSSVGVIHSHTREAAYYFKRSYIDRKALIQLLNVEPVNWQEIGIRDFSEMLEYIYSTYRKLDSAFNMLAQADLHGGEEDVPLVATLQHIISSHSAGDGYRGEPSMERVLRDLMEAYGTCDNRILATPDVLMEQFYSTLYSFNNFLVRRQFADIEIKDIVLSLHSLAGVVLGANLGDFSAFHKTGDDASSRIGAIFGNCV